MKKEVIVGVVNCARCGSNHEPLVFKRLTYAIEPNMGGFTHWTMCPMTKEPIMMVVSPA
jgi:hypothetical protein